MPRVTVLVGPNGELKAMSKGVGGVEVRSPRKVALTGLDGRLVRLFSRWVAKAEHGWTLEDLRAFGQVLHRMLFPDEELWGFVESSIAAAGDEPCRLLLGFPTDGPAARLAGFPWEYLHTPDTQSGTFLATDRRVVLARCLPLGSLTTPPPGPEVRVLTVVSNADEGRLGRVEATPVADSLKEAAHKRSDLSLLGVCEDPTLNDLARRVDQEMPDLLHFAGHGQFQDGVGGLAFRGDLGDYGWASDVEFATAVCAKKPPHVVVLQSCEVGESDFDYRFSGLAPELVDRGVGCVVAIQYQIEVTDAQLFCTLLYEEISDGSAVDIAVQSARRRLVDEHQRTRLLGMPIVYQRRAPLLAANGGS